MEKVKYRYNSLAFSAGASGKFCGIINRWIIFLCGSFHFPMCIFDRSAGIIVHHACIHKRD